MSIWDERYSGEDYFYGTEPNAFLVSQRSLPVLIDLVARKPD